ncbi:MAG: hypothetical protein U0797_16415 [Gemmataceae bacterium]
MNDQGDAVTQFVTLGGSGTNGTVEGLTATPINYQMSGEGSLTVRLGPATAAVRVLNTSVSTSLIGSGSVRFNVGSGAVSGVGGVLNVSGSAGSSLVIDDHADASPHAVNLATNDGGTASVGGLSPAPIVIGVGIASVDLNLGTSAGNTLMLNGAGDPAARTVNLDAGFNFPLFSPYYGPYGIITGLTPATINYHGALGYVTVQTGTGGDTVNVLATGKLGMALPPLTVVGHSATTVNVGQAGSVQNILGSLTVTNAAALSTALNIDDSADAASRVVTLDVAAAPGVPWLYGTVRGLAPANISYRASAVSRLTVHTGTGAETVNVRATAGLVTLVGHSGNTAVSFGSQGSTARIAADVTVVGGTSLKLDDSADALSRTVTVGLTAYYDASRVQHLRNTISGLAAGNVFYDASAGALELHTGTGAETVNIQSLAVPSVRLVAHSNGSTVNVGAGSVAGIHSAIRIDGGATANGGLATPRVVVNDSSDAIRQAVTVNPTTLPNAGAISSLPAGVMLPYEVLLGFAGLTVWTPAFLSGGSVTLETGPGGATVVGAAIIPTSLVGTSLARNTLVAGSGAWNLTGRDAGGIGLFSFAGFGSLTGASGTDSFVFNSGASLSGTLDGGGGADTLDYSRYGGNVMVNLQTARATAVANSLKGSFGAVVGANGGGRRGVFNILVGNGGVLRGGDGRRNLLIAGPKGATLLGGNDQDILIAGGTAYDLQPNAAALVAVMNQWTRTDLGYASRVANLAQGIGAPRLSRASVASNHASNTVQGGLALDWIFANLMRDRTDRVAPEVLTPL